MKGMLFSVSVRLLLSCRNFGLSVYLTWLNVLHMKLLEYFLILNF